MNNKEILKRIISIIEDSNLTNSEFAEKIGVPNLPSLTYSLKEIIQVLILSQKFQTLLRILHLII